MSVWIKEQLLKSIYDDIYQLQLLYEVDAESLADVDPTPRAYPLIPIGIIGTAGIVIPSVGVFTGYSTVTTISIAASVVTAGIAYRGLRSVTSVPRLLHSVIKESKAMHRIIRERERILFGQGMNGSQVQSSFRRKAVLLLRELISVFEISSKELANHMDGEQDGLMSNFYTKDISFLLEGDLSELSSDGAAATLVDILCLHISAFSRLLVVYLNRPFSLWMLYSFSDKIKAHLIPLLKKLKDLSKQPKLAVVPRKEDTAAATPLDDREAVALVLDGVSSSILSKSISPEEARAAIQKVLFMQWLRPVENEEQLAMENGSEDVENSSLPIYTPRETPIVDQAVVDKDYQQTACCDVEFSMERSAIASSFMGELRTILGDRSKEFDVRERKALATFYGITEEELLQREEESKRIEQEQKKEQLEARGEAVEDEVEWQQQRRAPLAADLVQVLSRRVPGKEIVLGDSSEDEITQ